MADPYREKTEMGNVELKMIEIREREETKRQQFKERELTRRTDGFVVRRLVLTAAFLIAGGISYAAYNAYLESKAPCTETTLPTSGDFEHKCARGTSAQIEGTRIVCRCSVSK